MRTLVCILGLCILLVGFVKIVQAEENARAHWIWYQSVSGAVNPIGLDLSSRISYQASLFEGKQGILWESTLWEVGLENSLTPAYDTCSFLFHIVPIAFFDLRIRGGVRYAYDALGFGVAPLAGYDSPFDADTRKSLDRRDGWGFRYQVSPTLQGKWGNVVFATTTHWVFFDMRGALDRGEEYYYEPSANVVLKGRDSYWGNDSVIAYRWHREEILAGLLHSITYVPGSGYVTERIALLGNLSLDLTRRIRMSVTALGGVYPQDRYLSCERGKVYGALQVGFRGALP
ncbi:MAG: hypothetical protein Kow009_10290 [Spirochaetales bacterium]